MLPNSYKAYSVLETTFLLVCFATILARQINEHKKTPCWLSVFLLRKHDKQEAFSQGEYALFPDCQLFPKQLNYSMGVRQL